MSTDQRAPGRPRDQRADRAILAAALRLLAEQGYAGMSIEAVAKEAGVGKSTIYRRYTDKPHLVAAALRSLVNERSPTPDTGNARLDLLELLNATIDIFESGGVFSMVGTLLVEERRSPELLDIFRASVISPRRRQFGEVLERGISRGEIHSRISIDATTEALVGAIYARYISGLPLTDRWTRDLLNSFWEGLAP